MRPSPVTGLLPTAGWAALGTALLYLVHDSASYVPGETLIVDGGWDVWGRLHAAAPA